MLPLEKILGLSHPSLASPPVQDKRTWREGMRPPESQQQQKALVWTAMDILTAYANKKGWVTAKAGRPDVNRAGNASACALISPLLYDNRSLILSILPCPRLNLHPPGISNFNHSRPLIPAPTRRHSATHTQHQTIGTVPPPRNG